MLILLQLFSSEEGLDIGFLDVSSFTHVPYHYILLILLTSLSLVHKRCLNFVKYYLFYLSQLGSRWSGGAMVLGKLPVPRCPTNLDYSRARAYCACSGCGWRLFGHIFSRLSFLSSFSLSLGDGPI